MSQDVLEFLWISAVFSIKIRSLNSWSVLAGRFESDRCSCNQSSVNWIGLAPRLIQTSSHIESRFSFCLRSSSTIWRERCCRTTFFIAIKQSSLWSVSCSLHRIAFPWRLSYSTLKHIPCPFFQDEIAQTPHCSDIHANPNCPHLDREKRTMTDHAELDRRIILSMYSVLNPDSPQVQSCKYCSTEQRTNEAALDDHVPNLPVWVYIKQLQTSTRRPPGFLRSMRPNQVKFRREFEITKRYRTRPWSICINEQW